MLIKILIRGKIEGVYTRRSLLKRRRNYNPSKNFFKSSVVMQSWILNKRKSRESLHPERLIKEEAELQPE